MTSRRLSLASIALCSGAITAQVIPTSLDTQNADLPNASSELLMRTNARMQQFYEMSEIGTDRVRVRAISLRFDGPATGAQVATHTIGELEIRIGATARGVDDLTADFEYNLTAPLQSAIHATSFVFHTDASGGGMSPWGGHAGELRFALPAPIVVDIPRHGSLAIEFRIANNTNGTARDSARVDFCSDTMPAIRGEAISEGVGCWHGTPMRVDTVGQYEPGTAFFVSGTGLPPDTPIGMLVTERLIQPLQIPNTPNCWLYVDMSSGILLPIQVANASGVISASDSKSGVPLPRSPRLRGSLLYVQAVAPLPPGSPYGSMLTSDYRTIKVGSAPAPRLRAWNVSSDQRSDASVATRTTAGALAIRIE